MRILASISITIFYCLFASAGVTANSSLVKLEKGDASSIYKIFNNGSKKLSKDDDPVINHGPSDNRLIPTSVLLHNTFFSRNISRHNPRFLRIKSSLSPPV